MYKLRYRGSAFYCTMNDDMKKTTEKKARVFPTYSEVLMMQFRMTQRDIKTVIVISLNENELVELYNHFYHKAKFMARGISHKCSGAIRCSIEDEAVSALGLIITRLPADYDSELGAYSTWIYIKLKGHLLDHIRKEYRNKDTFSSAVFTNMEDPYHEINERVKFLSEDAQRIVDYILSDRGQKMFPPRTSRNPKMLPSKTRLITSTQIIIRMLVEDWKWSEARVSDAWFELMGEFSNE